jgi:hypothetical protein
VGNRPWRAVKGDWGPGKYAFELPHLGQLVEGAAEQLAAGDRSNGGVNEFERDLSRAGYDIRD